MYNRRKDCLCFHLDASFFLLEPLLVYQFYFSDTSDWAILQESLSGVTTAFWFPFPIVVVHLILCMSGDKFFFCIAARKKSESFWGDSLGHLEIVTLLFKISLAKSVKDWENEHRYTCAHIWSAHTFSPPCCHKHLETDNLGQKIQFSIVSIWAFVRRSWPIKRYWLETKPVSFGPWPPFLNHARKCLFVKTYPRKLWFHDNHLRIATPRVFWTGCTSLSVRAFAACRSALATIHQNLHAIVNHFD